MRFLLPGLTLAFTVYCLVDVVRSESDGVRGLPKTLWVLLVLLFPLAGGAAWFIAGRPKASRLPGTGGLGRARGRVVAPDDDPDFLRSIDRPAPVDEPTPLEPDESHEGSPPSREQEHDDSGDREDPSGRDDRHP